MLAEYQLLRQESLAAITNRLTVMSFTFAALSVLVAGLLTSQADALTGVIAIVFLPQLSKAALLIWLGEYARSQRAGRFVAGLEKRINEHVGAETLGWESQLVTGEVHMSFPYSAVVVLLLGVGYAGAFLGGYFLYLSLHAELTDGSSVLVLGGLVDLVILFEAWFLRFFLREWWKARTGSDVQRPSRRGLTVLMVVAVAAASLVLYVTHADATTGGSKATPSTCGGWWGQSPREDRLGRDHAGDHVDRSHAGCCFGMRYERRPRSTNWRDRCAWDHQRG